MPVLSLRYQHRHLRPTGYESFGLPSLRPLSPWEGRTSKNSRASLLYHWFANPHTPLSSTTRYYYKIEDKRLCSFSRMLRYYVQLGRLLFTADWWRSCRFCDDRVCSVLFSKHAWCMLMADFPQKIHLFIRCLHRNVGLYNQLNAPKKQEAGTEQSQHNWNPIINRQLAVFKSLRRISPQITII